MQESRIRKTDKTYRQDKHILDRFLRTLQPEHLKDLSTKEIKDYILNRVEKGKINNVTVNNILRCVKKFFNWAIQQTYIADNPANKIKRLPEEHNPPPFLSVEETRELLKAAEGHYMYPMIATAVYTGMRLGELLSLEWPDIDFKKNTITVKNKVNFQTKSKRFRVIPLRLNLKEILSQSERPHDRCFTYKYPKYKETMTFKERPRASLDRIAKKAGINKKIGWHLLRHTFASHLTMQSEDLNTIRELLGHRDIKTALIYSHLSPSHLQNSIKKLPF